MRWFDKRNKRLEQNIVTFLFERDVKALTGNCEACWLKKFVGKLARVFCVPLSVSTSCVKFPDRFLYQITIWRFHCHLSQISYGDTHCKFTLPFNFLSFCFFYSAAASTCLWRCFRFAPRSQTQLASWVGLATQPTTTTTQKRTLRRAQGALTVLIDRVQFSLSFPAAANLNVWKLRTCFESVVSAQTRCFVLYQDFKNLVSKLLLRRYSINALLVGHFYWCILKLLSNRKLLKQVRKTNHPDIF